MNWLIAHLVGDYLWQNDWQALGKKKSSVVCGVHCALYTLSIWLFTGWPIEWLVLVFLLHFAQDRTGFVRWWMGVVGQDKFAGPPLGPWSIIVVDNVMHLVLLYFVDRNIAGQAPFTALPALGF